MPHRNSAHELNETATWFWKRFDGQRTLEDLLIEFCEEYETTTETARTEVFELVSDMQNKGLIE